MTEPLEPFDADPADLAASDALDGPGAASDAGVAADPDVAARLEEFRGVAPP